MSFNNIDLLRFCSLLHDFTKIQDNLLFSDKNQSLKTSIIDKIKINDEFKEKVKIVFDNINNETPDPSLDDQLKIIINIIKEADELTSSELHTSEVSKKFANFSSIFSSISLPNGEYPKFYQPISSLDFDNYKFLTPEPPDENQNLDKYKENISKLLEDISKFHDKIQIETLLNIFKKYLWCIPSPSYMPDKELNYSVNISLYEHSRLTLALANILYLLAQDGKLNLDNITNRDEERFILLCTDITGIQNFIYNISHTKALLALKGRSFLIIQYLYSIAFNLLRKFNLTTANLLYSSGGKFYVVLPNTNEAKKIIDEFFKLVQEELFERYNGSLNVVYAYKLLKGYDFKSDSPDKSCSIPDIWNEVTKKLETSKYRKFVNILKDEYKGKNDYYNKGFFEPKGDAKENIQCEATNVDLFSREDKDKLEKNKISETNYEIIFECKLEGKKVAYLIQEKDDNTKESEKPYYISEEQYNAIEIGKKAKHSNYLIFTEKNNSLIDSLEFVEKLSNNLDDNAIVYKLNDLNFINPNIKAQQGFMFYGGNNIEANAYLDIKTVGFDKLAVLRMDVDNLGNIFKSRINKPTFSKVVQLSFMLDYFFSGYLNQLNKLKWSVEDGVNEKYGENLKNLIQIIYSGGDDLFITGAWNVIPDVALWINQNFEKFTGTYYLKNKDSNTTNNERSDESTQDNLAFTLSAGISIFGKKFPLYIASEEAGEAEKRAKGTRLDKKYNQLSKNAICFLDTVVDWDDFKKIREDFVARYYSFIEYEKNRKSLLERLKKIYYEYTEDNNQLWSKWRWRAAYSLKRYADQYQNLNDDILKLQTELFSSNSYKHDFINYINMLAFWVDYLTRQK